MMRLSQNNLSLAGDEYLTGLTVYFIGYVIFEVGFPSELSPAALTRTDSVQHRPQIDESPNMASYADPRLGCGCYITGRRSV